MPGGLFRASWSFLASCYYYMWFYRRLYFYSSTAGVGYSLLRVSLLPPLQSVPLPLTR